MVSDIGYMSNSHKIGALYCTASPPLLSSQTKVYTLGGGFKSDLHKDLHSYSLSKILTRSFKIDLKKSKNRHAKSILKMTRRLNKLVPVPVNHFLNSTLNKLISNVQ
jgi:hypothetical protein